ncbi:hypothetical protein [Ideonella sp. A 288]|uniref:hypothetical protein n=1 Tax=Ideonella sp. A 288 TaxID=1962181 RepID=UPI001184A35F|nr:hypothetical protein [Ideonella sp. A 288]
MGLRDRYLSALASRCVVAVPRPCNTQQPAKLLRVAAPKEVQHATNDYGPAMPATVTRLHATNHATATQHAQHADHEAKVERSAIVSADGAPYWVADDLAGLPAWTDAEIVSFEKRVARSTWLGYPEAKGRAERLLHRDRGADDRRLCVECQHAGPGWRCAQRGAFLLDQLQRCPMFKENPL